MPACTQSAKLSPLQVRASQERLQLQYRVEPRTYQRALQRSVFPKWRSCSSPGRACRWRSCGRPGSRVWKVGTVPHPCWPVHDLLWIAAYDSLILLPLAAGLVPTEVAHDIVCRHNEHSVYNEDGLAAVEPCVHHKQGTILQRQYLFSVYVHSSRLNGWSVSLLGQTDTSLTRDPVSQGWQSETAAHMPLCAAGFRSRQRLLWDAASGKV